MKLRRLKEIHQSAFGSRKVRVLDFGCGTGEITAGLARFPGIERVDGVDKSAGMLREARRRHAGISKKKLRWRSLRPGSGPVGTYDWILAINTFHHLAPPRRVAAVRRLLRCLRPGGFFTILEHNANHPVAKWIVSRCPFDRGVRLLSQNEVRSLVAMTGGEARLRYLGFAPPAAPGAALVEKLFVNLPLGVQLVAWAQKPNS